MKHLITLILALTTLIIASPASAQNALDMRSFERLPIQHEGRLKPLSSFARLTLEKFSGQPALKDINANTWLAEALFDPQAAAERRIFAVTDKALIEKLKLDARQKLYSYAQLQPALQATRDEAVPLFTKDEKDLSPQGKALLALYENTAILTALMRSFTALLPLDIALPAAYQNNISGPLNFTELLKIEKQLEADLAQIITRKGRDPSKYSEDELAIAKASFHLNALRTGGNDNALLRVIPIQWPDSKETWASPWSVMLQGQGSPASAFLLSQWGDLAEAYRRDNAQDWSAATASLLSETEMQAADKMNLTRLKTEQLYRTIHPYNWIITLYLLSAITAALFMFKPTSAQNRIVQYVPLALAATGITAHTIALAARIYILDRPPVGTLYESILFVTLICTILGLILSRPHSYLPLITACAMAAILLFCAPIFSAGKDNLEVLSAVLNTNFWLTTHVLCITAGYGVCILTAGIAHAALYIRGFKKDQALWQKLQSPIHRLSIAALLLTAIGTALGGIWADQSWGRFWGWDPKENGALLIVLWLIWIQHGRISAKLSPAAFIALNAATNIIVALSWFGVNLLNVGLHSYGFTSGLAGGLTAFCIAEILLITTLYIAAQKQERPA